MLLKNTSKNILIQSYTHFRLEFSLGVFLLISGHSCPKFLPFLFLLLSIFFLSIILSISRSFSSPFLVCLFSSPFSSGLPFLYLPALSFFTFLSLHFPTLAFPTIPLLSLYHSLTAICSLLSDLSSFPLNSLTLCLHLHMPLNSIQQWSPNRCLEAKCGLLLVFIQLLVHCSSH